MAYKDLTATEQKSVADNLQKVIEQIAPDSTVTPAQAFDVIDMMVAERSDSEDTSQVVTNAVTGIAKAELECQLSKLAQLDVTDLYPNCLTPKK